MVKIKKVEGQGNPKYKLSVLEEIKMYITKTFKYFSILQIVISFMKICFFSYDST